MPSIVRVPRSSDLLSFEASFLLFLTVGSFKGLPLLAAVQSFVDLTLVSATAVFVGVLAIFVGRDGKVFLGVQSRRYLLVYIVLIALVLVSYAAMVGPDSDKSTEKIARLLYFNSAGVLGAVMVIRSEARMRRFLRLIVSVALLTVAVAVATTGPATRQLGVTGPDSYQGLSRIVGLGFTVVLVSIFDRERNRTGGLRGEIVVAGILLTALVASGARQAFLGVMVIVLFLILRQTTASRLDSAEGFRQMVPEVWLRTLASVAVVALVVFGFVSVLGEQLPGAGGGRRLTRTVETVTSGEIATDARVQIWAGAIDTWSASPILGIGFGKFSADIDNVVFNHPHNIFLELAVELGVVGLVIGGFLFWFPWRSAIRGWQQEGTCPYISAMFIFLICAALVSGDLADNRALFAVGGLVTVHCGRAASVRNEGLENRRELGNGLL